MSTLEEVSEILGIASQAYGHYELTDETIDVYHRLLQDLEQPLLQASIEQCIAECEFFPTVAKIRAKALDLTRDTSIPTAFEAWEEVVQNARHSCGNFSYPMIADAVRAIGGIKMLGMADKGDMISHRARFLECYGTLEKRGDDDRAMLPGVRAVAERMALPI